jgi:hypothetical protein
MINPNPVILIFDEFRECFGFNIFIVEQDKPTVLLATSIRGPIERLLDAISWFTGETKS